MDACELLDWAASVNVTDDLRGKRSRGCLGHSLLISDFPSDGGRGLAAARELKNGELILSVPKDALLNLETAKQDARFCTAWRQFPNLSSTQALVAYLLNEVGKGQASRWCAYVRSLPRSYDTLPYYHTFEIQALQVEDAIWTAERAVEKIQKEWKETRPLLKILALKCHLMTWKAWLWASSTVSSRTLHIPWDTAGTLCPIGDLFNYAAPGALFIEDVNEVKSMPKQGHCEGHAADCKSNSAFADGLKVDAQEENDDVGNGLHFTERLTDGGYEASSAAYCFYARQDYKRGDQVLLCYGLYNNLELLEHYGFVLAQNPNDHVYVNLFSLEELAQQAGWLQRLGPHMRMYVQIDGRPSFQLLAALRLCCTSSSTLRKRAGHLALAGLQLSIESDIVLYERLKAKCVNLLMSLPTTILVDNALKDVVLLCSSVEGLSGLIDHTESSMKAARNRSIAGDTECKLLEDSVCGWRALSQIQQQQVLDEVRGFLQSQTGTSRRESDLALQRWWLAIDWRRCYKKILDRCISVCQHELLILKQYESVR